MTWRIETLNKTVDRDLDALPVDIRARFARICRLIATVGLERVGTPHVRHLTGPLWEMHLTGRDGIARALYVTAAGRSGGDGMSTLKELHEPWSREAGYREAYKRLGPEFEVARALIEARSRAGLTQAELAERMKTTQSAVARLESGRSPPSTRTLEKIARATGTRLRISFDPA